ncbi:hypothetical protein BD414DRAFT_456506 [Trametes punicea]|nr:hypothetical protein BD414DRAFT_456506 [Trametes punicea]
MFNFLGALIRPPSQSTSLSPSREGNGHRAPAPSFPMSGRESSQESTRSCSSPSLRGDPTGPSSNLFFKALRAPYIVPPSPQRPIRGLCERSGYQRGTTMTCASPPSPDLSSSDDEDEDELDAPEVPEELLDRPVYEPTGKFAWAKNQPLSESNLLCNLHVDAMYSISLMKGRLGDREITYMCKSWSRIARPVWKGFYAEIKLYSSPRYLRDLQGSVVPNFINLYAGVCSISFVMEPPHHSFWIEASAHMPNVLKKQVILSYIALHSQGILHGDPELHNILIGGDGRVTLMNFHAARARTPIPKLELLETNRAEMALELRQVMFKLDYEGARSREYAKMKRVAALEKGSTGRRKVGSVPDGLTLEERRDPPPPLIQWKTRWINSLDREPRRVVVPGQTPEELARAVESFCQLINTWEVLEAKDVVSPLIRVVSTSPPPSRLPSPSSIVPEESVLSSAHPESNSRKRKAEHDPDQPESDTPLKRARGEEGKPSPALPPYERSSTAYDTGTSAILLPAASTTNAEPRVDRVRDFAYEPYDGPRGYYFPHPPTEALRDQLRAVQIRNDNAIACGKQGLPYFRMDRWYIAPPTFKRLVPKGMHISLGALKRKRADAERPMSTSDLRRAKKRRFEEDRVAALAEDRAVRFNDMVSYHDPPREGDYDQGTAQRLSAGQSQRSGGGAAKARRSILKRTRPVKTVSYDLAQWGGASSISGGLEFFVAKPPTDVLGMYRERSTAEPSGGQLPQIDGPDPPRQLPPEIGAVETQAGNSSNKRQSSSIDGDDRGAPMDTPRQLSLEEQADRVTAHWPALSAESKLRASDASAAARDSRSIATSADGGMSRYDRVSWPEEHDLEEEMEVEAILYPR